MKTKLLIASFALALPAFAESTAKQALPAPVPQSELWTWFTGGSVGYLVDAQAAMYNAHIGVNTPWELGGWNVALFGEVGYSRVDDNTMASYTIAGVPGMASVDAKTDIIPITLNIKFERAIADNLHFYAGAGLGAAVVDISTSSSVPAANYSHNQTVFTAQVFSGLTYHFSPAFEAYGGARWIYLNDVKIANSNYNLHNNDCLFELGLRFTF